jgi:hypothetical protein
LLVCAVLAPGASAKDGNKIIAAMHFQIMASM